MAEATDTEESKTKEANGSVKTIDKYGFYSHPHTSTSEALLPAEVLRRREHKWLEMLANWEKWITKRGKKVRDRCRKGIPNSVRAQAWQKLTGSHLLLKKHTGVFQEYLRMVPNPKCVEDINKDLHRNFPQHEMFATEGGIGQQKLRDLLVAYTIHNPQVGYCQAMAPIAAVFLMHMPLEQAFWAFDATLQSYMRGYFNPGLEQVQVDGELLMGLLKRNCPSAHKLLQEQSVTPMLFMTEWFMCIYTRTLPWASVLRVLDLFLSEGSKVLFWVALVLLEGALGSTEQQRRCPSMYETLEAIKHLPPRVTQEDELIRECLKFRLSQELVDSERAAYHTQFKDSSRAKRRSRAKASREMR